MPSQPIAQQLAADVESYRPPRLFPGYAAREFLPKHMVPPLQESCWQGKRSCSLTEPWLPKELTLSGSLRCENSSNREQDCIYKLVIHHHCARVQQINSQQQRPEPAKMWIRKCAVDLGRTRVSLPQAEQADH